MKKLHKKTKYFTSEMLKDPNPKNYLNKLKDEIKEVEENVTDAEEFADCLIALFGASINAGITYEELKKAALKKIKININREWVQQPDGTFQHKK
jgi:hypothetical protein